MTFMTLPEISRMINGQLV